MFNVLGITNASDSLSEYKESEKGLATIYILNFPSSKGLRASSTRTVPVEVLTLKEPGLYKAILKSRKEEAKRFQHWVFHDVLPTLRKTGSYSIPESHEPITKPQTEPGLYHLIFRGLRHEEWLRFTHHAQRGASYLEKNRRSSARTELGKPRLISGH